MLEPLLIAQKTHGQTVEFQRAILGITGHKLIYEVHRLSLFPTTLPKYTQTKTFPIGLLKR